MPVGMENIVEIFIANNLAQKSYHVLIPGTYIFVH